MGWVTAADYRRGRIRDDRPCQDYGMAARLEGGSAIAAVASGARTARLGHLGAKTAVRAALSALSDRPRPLRSLLGRPEAAAAADFFDILRSDIGAALAEAAAARVAPADALATSLLVFAAGPEGLVAMRIGDGLLVYRAVRHRYDLAFAAPGDGHLAFGRDDTLADVSVHEGPVEFVCAATSALTPVLIRATEAAPQDAFFQPLDRYGAIALDDGEMHRGIRSFLRSERLAEQLDGDMTLALCRRRSERAHAHLATAAAH